MTVGTVRIGISGWRYKGWRTVFYPKGLAHRRELEYASRAFGTIEINGTFYSLQKPAYFRQWAAETPEGFVFALKGSRYVTHMLKLRNVERPLANFFASGVLALGTKMGPVLWQFPPQVRFDRHRFLEFFNLLPRTTGAMAKLAQACDDKMLPRSVLEAEVEMPVRHCVEIRHESFATPEFVALLREQRVGLVVADTVEWPLLMDMTADFAYLRLHGSEQLYVSGYETEALDAWADRVVAFATGGLARGRYAGEPVADGLPRDVYVYFDNDAKVRAPFDALELQERVNRRLSIAAE